MNSLESVFASNKDKLNFQLMVYKSASELCETGSQGIWGYNGDSFMPIQTLSNSFSVKLADGTTVEVSKEELGLLSTTRTLEKLLMNPSYGYLKEEFKKLKALSLKKGIYKPLAKPKTDTLNSILALYH